MRAWPISSAGADGGTKITGYRGASAPADQRQPRDCLPSAPPQRLPNVVLTLNSQIWAIPRLIGIGSIVGPNCGYCLVGGPLGLVTVGEGLGTGR